MDLYPMISCQTYSNSGTSTKQQAGESPSFTHPHGSSPYDHKLNTHQTTVDHESGPCAHEQQDHNKYEKLLMKRFRNNEKDCESQDPLTVTGSDIMLIILSRLDARSLASTLVVSRSWCTLASTDVVWSKKCEELWAGKAHLPRFLETWGLSKLSAYSLSVKDGERTRIMKEDLWDHAWEFRFKEAAPEYFRNRDPHWTGKDPPMHRYFHPDGIQTADSDDQVWGRHECCYTIVTSILADGKMREHYVRINRWPQMRVSRRRDWGWEMSNHLYCYSSVPDALTKGGTGPDVPLF